MALASASVKRTLPLDPEQQWPQLWHANESPFWYQSSPPAVVVAAAAVVVEAVVVMVRRALLEVTVKQSPRFRRLILITHTNKIEGRDM
jgi:hypothetical protein